MKFDIARGEKQREGGREGKGREGGGRGGNTFFETIKYVVNRRLCLYPPLAVRFRFKFLLCTASRGSMFVFCSVMLFFRVDCCCWPISQI